jgi:hypothetical protein
VPPAVLRRFAAAAAAPAARQPRPPSAAARMLAAPLPPWRQRPEPRHSAGTGGCFCCLLLLLLLRALVLHLLSVHLPLGGSTSHRRPALVGRHQQSCQRRPFHRPRRCGGLLPLLLLLTPLQHSDLPTDQRAAALPQLPRPPGSGCCCAAAAAPLVAVPVAGETWDWRFNA